MKKLTYLFITMLLALTMVGCQTDLSDYLTKEEADAKYATIAYVDGKVAELETKIKDIDAKFEKYYTKGEVDEKLEGYATKESLEAIGDISKAVKEYLATVDWNDYIEDGYTNDEIDAKLEAITNITSKLEETYATLEKVTELSTKVTSLETTVATLSGKVTTLENKPAPSGNGGDGYCGLSASEVEKIKTLLTQWANNNINGVVYSLTDYVKESDLAGYVKIENLPSLEDYAKKTDIKDFTSDIATLTSRITTVENMLKADGTVGKKLAELETKVNNTNATEVTELKNTVDTIKAWYEANKDKVTNLNLADYLTVANAENTYATKSSVETVASSLANLKSRVETLETILEIEKRENGTISKLKVDYLALKSTVGTLATSEALAELSGTIETLKTTVANNKTYLEGKIADSDTNIGAIKTRVDNLENAQATFDTFVTTTTSAIATINGTLSNKANASDVKNETQIKELIANAITNSTTLVTKTYLEAQKYLTSGSLSGYATTEKVTELETTVNEAKTYIESINSKYASLVSNMVEMNANIIDEYESVGHSTEYYYYPYVKFINANGTVEYMTLLKINNETKFGFKSSDGTLSFKDVVSNGLFPKEIKFMSETKFNETVNSLKE